MKLEFQRTIEVKKYTCYLKLLVQRERLDIQKYLEKFQPNPNDNVIKNVNKYMEKKGWVHEGQVTTKGKEIVFSGKVWEEEEGKYSIYCLIDDPLLDSLPLKLERIAPEKQEKTPLNQDNLSSLKNTEFHLLNEEYPKIKINEIPIHSLERIPEEEAKAKLIWKLEFENNSSFEISKYNLKGQTKSIDHGSLLDSLFQINNSFGEWSKAHKKLKVKFDKNKSGEMEDFYKKELSLNTSQFQYGKFDSCKIYNIPLMPKDKLNAEEWRNYLLEKHLVEDYKNQKESTDISERIIERDEFKDFGLDSNIDTLKNYFSKMNKGKVFWHFFAPLDLDPRHIIHSPSDTFSINPHTKISFIEIVNNLHISSIPKISKIIYYDLYVLNERQQRNFKLFVDSIFEKTQDKNISVELITLFKNKSSKENRSDYLKKTAPFITETDVGSISKGKLNHSRYLILFDKNNQKTIWKIDNSIDFLDFSNASSVDINTQGTSRDVSFVRHKDDRIFYPDLRNYINKGPK
jgi:hypothetical protein